jgi:hypothetical protein
MPVTIAGDDARDIPPVALEAVTRIEALFDVARRDQRSG